VKRMKRLDRFCHELTDRRECPSSPRSDVLVASRKDEVLVVRDAQAAFLTMRTNASHWFDSEVIEPEAD